MSDSEERALLEQLRSREAGLSVPEPVSAELYEELLNRYEKALFFAGQLQERVRRDRQVATHNEDLEDEVKRLKELVDSAERYTEVLEGALNTLGVKSDSRSS